MEYLVNSKQMKSCDAYTIEHFGVPALILMERAALAVVETLHQEAFDLERVLIVCSVGNNGADGLAAARLLHLEGVNVAVQVVGDPECASDQWRVQMKMIQAYGIQAGDIIDEVEYTTIVDAVFGVGLSREVTGIYARAIGRINESSARILAVDIPSGINADSGAVMGCAVRADVTVTFAFRKLGCVLYPGTEYAGSVIVAQIGIDEHGFAGSLPEVIALDSADLLKIPPRSAYSNKGSYGKVLVVAGSENMCGAAFFTACAAYRMGCGLVRIFTPACNRTILLQKLPEAMITSYDPADFAESVLEEAIEWADVIAVGPGIGMDTCARRIVKGVLKACSKPLILDADALNILASDGRFAELSGANCILTPHLGELGRLAGQSVAEIAADVLASARSFAREKQVVCVAKDARTVTASPQGQICVNRSGCNAMAKGGSGDILTGVIAGLLAQRLGLFDAASLGAYIHGLAGEAAASRLGSYSVLASDILDALAEVLKGYCSHATIMRSTE